MSQIAKNIRHAHSLIEKYGWFQKSHKPNCYCIVTAIFACDTSTSARGETLRFVRDQLPEGEWGINVIEFNDYPTTTKKNVLDLLDKAASKAEELNV